MRIPWIPTLLTFLLILVGCVGCAQVEPNDVANGEQAVVAADFCEEHQIAEAECPWCDPSLIESLGFCRGHGVPEAFCYRCNKDLVPAFKAIGDWCAEHDRPETQCYICNPEKDPFKEDAAESDAPGTSAPAPESIPRAQRPPTTYCTKQELIVRFESPDIPRNAGLEFATVESRPITQIVECNAEIEYDGNRYAHVASQVSGRITKVHKDLGDSVVAGEALVTIASPQLGAAKATYLQALAALSLWDRDHARHVELSSRSLTTEKDLLESETRLAESRISLSEAEQALHVLGFSANQIERIGEEKDTNSSYDVTASFAGVVIDRDAVLGEIVEPSASLFAVADVARMWAILEIYESDVQNIRIGQSVVLAVDGLPGDLPGGYITWISAELDPTTRTLRTRVELENKSGRLRAHMFARASISIRSRRESVVVPASSVQWEGCCNVVFVKKSETVFEPRKVHLGAMTGTLYEVLSGTQEGEEVVTQGSFLLKTELMKGSIGAGCCEARPGS